MNRYFKASDSIVKITNGKEELSVTERAFKLSYAAKGYKLSSDVQLIKELTVREIKAQLDEAGIEYPSSARKDELIQLLGK